MLRKAPVLILCLIGLLFLSAPANAQTTLKGLNLSFDAASVKAPERAARPLAGSSGDVAAVAAAQARGSGAARKYVLRAFAGFWLGSGDGVELGGGVSTRPFSDAKHELQGNGSFLRVESENAFVIDANYLYNFLGNNVGEFAPYAGGGLIIAFPAVGESDAGLQIGGGLKKPFGNGKEFFGELYFAFVFDNPVILRAGIGW